MSQANATIYLSPPHMSGREQAFVAEAFSSNFLAPLGPMVEAFEREFAAMVGIPHCLALNSGTAAMHLALREAGVKPGDHVLTSTLTFIGSVSPITFLGAEPVFIDADAATWNMDPNLLHQEMQDCVRANRLPAAVVPTDLYGQCADLDAIKAVCRPYGIPVICDAAESAGASYKGRPAGQGVDAAIYSFNGNKIITTSGGGMLASADPALIEHARHLSTQAREPAPHYEHREIGYNYRMSSIAAAIGRGQLTVLSERVEARRRIFATYRRLLGDLPGLGFMPEAPYGCCSRWLTVITINKPCFGATPEDVRLALEADHIQARPVWKPMHLQPVFKGCRVCGGSVSEDLFKRGLCLPSGSALQPGDIERIVDILRKTCI